MKAFNYKLAFWALVLTLVAGGTGYWVRGVEITALEKFASELFQVACLDEGKNFPAAKKLKDTCSALYKSSRDEKLSNPFKLISRVKAESGFCSRPVGPTKDIGCMMVHLPTWGATPFGCDVVMSDRCNIAAGVKIYTQYFNQFNNDGRLADIAYVGGPAAAYRHRNQQEQA